MVNSQQVEPHVPDLHTSQPNKLVQCLQALLLLDSPDYLPYLQA